jgi:cytosine/uracil/thiamine/allantoin permease
MGRRTAKLAVAGAVAVGLALSPALVASAASFSVSHYQDADGQVYWWPGQIYTKYNQTWATFSPTAVISRESFTMAMGNLSEVQVTGTLDMTSLTPKTFYYNVHPSSDVGTIPPGSYILTSWAGNTYSATNPYWSGTLTW